MPGAGGTYLYLRRAFHPSTGHLMPFLFVWTAMLATPMVMATGAIGILHYLATYFPSLTGGRGKMATVGIVAFVVVLLYRDIRSIARLTQVLCIIMFLTVGVVIVAALSHFDPRIAFDYPPHAFHFGRPFFAGLGAALIIALYDYAGYNTTAYMAGEVKDPGRVVPRSIVGSIVIIMSIYLVMNLGILGVVPWREVVKSDAIGNLVMERTWGPLAARGVTALIIVTALASMFTGLLGGSRVPWNAARDRVFFPAFARLHPTLHFPHVSVLVMGVATAIATFLPLESLINLLTAVMVLVQSLGQIFALVVLRRREPRMSRPYRIGAYPLVPLFAAAGWIYVYIASGLTMILLSLAWVVGGSVAFLLWARAERRWPFGPRETAAPLADLTPEAT